MPSTPVSRWQIERLDNHASASSPRGVRPSAVNGSLDNLNLAAHDRGSPFRLAVIQANSETGDLVGNRKRLGAMIEEAAVRGAELVVLPELASCGYALRSRDEAASVAEPAEEGATTGDWQRLARLYGIHICGGFAERHGANIFNSAALIGPDGVVGVYRKAFLWDRERPVFDPGDGTFETYAVGDCRVAMMICYDAWQPEVPRLLKLLGADVLLCPAVWTNVPAATGTDLPHAVHIAVASAHLNRCVIAAASQCGTDRDREYLGMSCIAGPAGVIAGPAGVDEDTLLGSFSLQELWASHRWTNLSHVFGDRRPDIIDVSYRGQRVARHAHAPPLDQTPLPFEQPRAKE